ncbi:MAG TPA: hypothetical protein VJY35_07455 [Candidatus Eisenbacteria bacterium]|nr:hypothetical protein [Candidatus Eisenbacteria bacterium]
MPLQCQFCGAPVTLSAPIPRESSCESCRHDYRACKQCRHYDPSRNNACRETEADLVEDKERRNFCEFFDFNPAPFRGQARDASRESQARAKLEGLFGGAKATPDRVTDARARLDALFKKPPASED